MTDNIYKVPEANLETESSLDTHEFYVVSKTKFLILIFGTVGFYYVYWFYKNWRFYSNANNLKVWPVPRAFFSIFFVHSLFSAIAAKAKAKDVELQWNSNPLATLYVIVVLTSNIMDQLSMKEILSPYSDMVSVILLPAIAWILFKVQDTVNWIEGDPDGSSNARITPANIAWLFFGALLWFVVLLATLDILGVISLD